jgi:outer membrane biosynthesis protein TonB
MDLSLNKDEKKALTTTVAVHVLLILLFIFTGLSYMEPPPPEEGIMINFGFEDQGSGDVQTQSNVQTEQQIVKEQITQEAAPSKSVQDEMLTQDSEEAPKVNTEKSESIREEEKVKEDPKPSKELSDAMSKWKNKSDDKSSSDGITGEKGDQGDPSGSLESGSYVGGSGGSGFKFKLYGRKMIAKPRIKDVSQDEGKVVVEIIVDRYGKVVRATPGVRGSTTTSSILYKIAKEAALSTKFNTNIDAPEQQKGQIVFTFLVKG